MTANPLMTATAARPGRVTVDMLHEMVASLNATRFVQDSGLPYFVNKKVDAKGVTHFLDRKVAVAND